MSFRLSDLSTDDLADKRVKESAKVIKQIQEDIESGRALFDISWLAMEYESLATTLGEMHPLYEGLMAESDNIFDKIENHVRKRTAINKAMIDIRDYPGIEAEEGIKERKQYFSRLAAEFCLNDEILGADQKLRYANLALKYDLPHQPSNLTILAMAHAWTKLKDSGKAFDWLFSVKPEKGLPEYRQAREDIISLLEATNQANAILPIMLRTMYFYPEIADRWVNLGRDKDEAPITLDQKIQDEPENADNYLVKGVYECVTGVPEQGLVNIRKSYDMARTDDKIPAYFLVNYAECLAKYGPEDQAREFITTRLEKNRASEFVSEKMMETLSALWLREAGKAFERDDSQAGLNSAFEAAQLRRMKIDFRNDLISKHVSQCNYG